MDKSSKNIILFKNTFLEKMTHVNPIIPILLWGPFISYNLYHSSQNNISISLWAILAFGGLLFWSLAEYLLHRYVFHFVSEHKLIKHLVFLFHGVHHDDPDDATRLVMPPLPALIIASIFYGLFYVFLGELYTPIFFSFFMIGYLLYDYIHYATHHIRLNYTWFKKLKRNHLYHHVHSETLFGVSSPLWDIVFNTIKK